MNNVLYGKPLLYLIGASARGMNSLKKDDPSRVVEGPYGFAKVAPLAIAYGNLFDQTETGLYGPYMKQTDTAEQYDERVPDPHGAGWHALLAKQASIAKRQGYQFIEWDNTDGYEWKYILKALALAQDYGLKVIAKNPLLTTRPNEFVHHPNVTGVIIERNAGSPWQMDSIRDGRPLPLWFVFDRIIGAPKCAEEAKALKGVGVTYSTHAGVYGYEDVHTLLTPHV